MATVKYMTSGPVSGGEIKVDVESPTDSEQESGFDKNTPPSGKSASQADIYLSGSSTTGSFSVENGTIDVYHFKGGNGGMVAKTVLIDENGQEHVYGKGTNQSIQAGTYRHKVWGVIEDDGSIHSGIYYTPAGS